MKILKTLVFCLLLVNSFSQTSTVSMQDDFKLMSNYSGGNKNGYNVIPTYKPNHIDGSSYFSDNWSEGSITTKNGQEFTNQLLFMFDRYNNDLYYKHQDSSLIMKVDPEQIASFTLNTEKKHLFMPAGYFSNKFNGQYFEVLVFNNHYSLLKYHQVSLQNPPYSEVAQVANNEQNSKFVEKKRFFLFKEGQLKEIDLKKKSVENAVFKEDIKKFDDYFSSHSGLVNEQYVINLINTIDQQ